MTIKLRSIGLTPVDIQRLEFLMEHNGINSRSEQIRRLIENGHRQARMGK